MRTIILVGTYPPRRCGIATFTAELRDSLVSTGSDLNCSVVAMSDEALYEYPAEVGYVIRQNKPADYVDVDQRINAANPDVLCIQHEFGIFGGSAGTFWRFLTASHVLLFPLFILSWSALTVIRSMYLTISLGALTSSP